MLALSRLSIELCRIRRRIAMRLRVSYLKTLSAIHPTSVRLGPGIKLALCFALGFVMIGGTLRVASAQEDISQKQIPSFELDQADVREAIRALFKNVSISYSISPE